MGVLTNDGLKRLWAKIKALKEEILTEVKDTYAAGGTIGGWEISEGYLKKTGIVEGNDVNLFLTYNTLRVQEYENDSDNLKTTLIQPGYLCLTNEDTYAEFYAATYNNLVYSYGNKVCLDNSGLFLWNYNGTIDPNKALNILRISTSNNLEFGYGKYTEGKYATNIYAGTDINFYSKSLNTNWRPYYKKGDSVTISWHGAGYITSSSKQLLFSVSLSKPPIGVSSVSVSNVDGLTVRQGGKYLYGSSASANTKSGTYSAIIADDGNSVRVSVTFTSTTNVTNNDVCGIYASLKFTFS